MSYPFLTVPHLLEAPEFFFMYTFFQRKKMLDVVEHVHRLCDLTVSPSHSQAEENRSGKRYSRSLPVAVHPWLTQPLAADQLVVCLAHNLCDQGIGLVVSTPLKSKAALIGFWLAEKMDEPWFFHADVRTVEQTGTGLWRIGAELTEFMNSRRRKEVLPIFDATKELLTLPAACGSTFKVSN